MLVTEIRLEIGDGSSRLPQRSSEVVSYSKETVKLNVENKPQSDLLQNRGSHDLISGVLYSDMYAGDELLHMTDNAEASLWSHFYISRLFSV